MNYSQWAQEYYDSAETLKEIIHNLQNQLKTAALHELPDLNFRINTMRGMYTECMRVGNILVKRKGEV
ncbi:MAG: hypothetical protein IJU51_06160 [Clostridia bacterium]|nr:hypothetical protein [Clostridia bacterium]